MPVLSIIPEGVEAGEQVPSLGGAVQGHGYGKHQYRGPKPPFNWSHNYRFCVYVLNSKLELPASSKRKKLLKAMEGKILQIGTLWLMIDRLKLT